jgi:hypothetical protein
MTPARRPAELVPLIQAKLLAGVTAYREAGKLLLEAKESLDHGKWEAWLKKHFSLTGSTARRYMAVAKLSGSQYARVRDLPLRDVRTKEPRMTYTPSPPPPDDTEEDGYDPEVEAVAFLRTAVCLIAAHGLQSPPWRLQTLTVVGSIRGFASSGLSARCCTRDGC